MNKSVFSHLFVFVLLWLVGCGPAPVTPTPLAPTVTPSSIPTSAPTHTPTLTLLLSSTTTPQNTPSPTLTRPPTRTPRPTATPEGQFAPLLSEPFLSSLGQLAYVKNQVLWVETEPGSANFLAVDRYVSQAQWSADGSRLLYAWNSNPQRLYRNGEWGDPEDFRLYAPVDQGSLSFNESITGFPTSPVIEKPCPLRLETTQVLYRFLNMSPDGSKILFAVTRNDDIDNDLITVVDASMQTNLVIMQCVQASKIQVPFVSNELFVSQVHCGSPCQALSGYDYLGNSVWVLPWFLAVQFDLSADEQTIINGGHFVPWDDPIWTLNLIDFQTGEITNLVPLVDLTLPETYFTPFVRPALSPDGSFIGFYYGGVTSYSPGTLYIIDLAGNLIEQWVDSEVIDWRPGGGPVIRQGIGEVEYQLVYSAMDGAAATPITTTSNPITVGRWSPDGQFFHLHGWRRGLSLAAG